MSGLRGRIAEVLRVADRAWDEVSDPHVNQADAVIRELRLDEAAQDCRCQLRHVWETSND